MLAIQELPAGVTFVVKVPSPAKMNAITGELGGALKLSLTSAPVAGRANQACIKFFVKLLKLPRSSITIASGQTSHKKMIRISGFSAEEVRKRIASAAVPATALRACPEPVEGADSAETGSHS